MAGWMDGWMDGCIDCLLAVLVTMMMLMIVLLPPEQPLPTSKDQRGVGAPVRCKHQKKKKSSQVTQAKRSASPLSSAQRSLRSTEYNATSTE